MTLRESDVPKLLLKEGRKFVARPGWPLIAINEIDVLRAYGRRLLSFVVLNRTPAPFMAGVGVKFEGPGSTVWLSAKDFIGPFGRDEWMVDVPGEARRVSIRVGAWPVEVALAEVTVELGEPTR